ncbi:MAG: hypothetical protein ACR2GG_05740, partial [Gemmatimonadaceae bacterium]
MKIDAIERESGHLHDVPSATSLVIKLRYTGDVRYVILLSPANQRADMTAIRKTLQAESGW